MTRRSAFSAAAASSRVAPWRAAELDLPRGDLGTVALQQIGAGIERGGGVVAGGEQGDRLGGRPGTAARPWRRARPRASRSRPRPRGCRLRWPSPARGRTSTGPPALRMTWWIGCGARRVEAGAALLREQWSGRRRARPRPGARRRPPPRRCRGRPSSPGRTAAGTRPRRARAPAGWPRAAPRTPPDRHRRHPRRSRSAGRAAARRGCRRARPRTAAPAAGAHSMRASFCGSSSSSRRIVR